MSITSSSKRYAQAVFRLAKEKNNFSEWQIELNRIAELMKDAAFISFVENPKVAFELKARLTSEILGKINPLAMNLVYLLISKNKMPNSIEIATAFSHLVDEYNGIKRAEVVTALAIEPSEQNKIIKQLETITHCKISADFEVNPNILGGIITRVDGTLIDGSVRTRLETLKKVLAGSK